MRTPLKALLGVALTGNALFFLEGGQLKVQALHAWRRHAVQLEMPADGIFAELPILVDQDPLRCAAEGLLELGGEAELRLEGKRIALRADPVTVELAGETGDYAPLKLPQPRLQLFPLKRVYARTRLRSVEYVTVHSRGGRAVFTPPGLALPADADFTCRIPRDLFIEAYEAVRNLAEPMWVGFAPKKFENATYAILVVQSRLGQLRMTCWVAPTID